MNSLGLIFLSSFTIAFSGALMPGPLLTVTISESSRQGWIVGPRFILGHAVLEFLLLVGLFLGLAPLLTSPAAFIFIAFAGGAVMLWMAWGMFHSLPSLSFDSSESHSGKSLELTGALLSLANPYWIIWWATIGLGYVLSSRDKGIAGVGAFYFGHILADLIWYSFVSVGVHRGKKILPLKVYRGMIAVCALFLTAYAGYLFVNGIRTVIN
ncbi:MAG: lysine transporter LysE [Spirochaetaceae bacterium 4572_59]|nr:MAG: lysine transporter LysE [Spirochaetaceae bacterium 4572_59]